MTTSSAATMPDDDPQPVRGSDPLVAARTLKTAMKKMERLENGLRRAHESIATVRDDLSTIQRALDLAPVPTRRQRHPAPAPIGPEPTVHDLSMNEVGNHRAVAIFDGAKEVRMSAMLKDFLAILAADDEMSPDDLVGSKTFKRLRVLMEKKWVGHAFDRHAISQLLWRLRCALDDAGLDRRLIQISRAGARLRLKRAPAGIGEG